MRSNSVAIQGSVASFHELAAHQYFGSDIQTIHCNSFRDVCSKISSNQVDYGLIAIENKIAGSILLNYGLIESFDLSIIGETFLPIELQLMGKQEATIDGIREIISHPMALGQCQQFLSELSQVRVTEFKDTASSAELVSLKSDNLTAVIAGPEVALRYGLKILANNVCDESMNYTRFYVLTKGNDVIPDADKASITIQLNDEAGELAKLLTILHRAELNLTKIQSIPIPNNTAQYAFHLDIQFSSKQQLEKALTEVAFTATSMRILGIYKGAKLPVSELITH